jgi:hypothetical protein
MGEQTRSGSKDLLAAQTVGAVATAAKKARQHRLDTEEGEEHRWAKRDIGHTTTEGGDWPRGQNSSQREPTSRSPALAPLQRDKQCPGRTQQATRHKQRKGRAELNR